MKITLFGAGYVGLVSAACFAEMGNDVLCVDIDKARVKRLRDNELPFSEPGLAPLIQSNQASGRLRFSDKATDGIEHAALLFVAVGTPGGHDGAAQLSDLIAVVDQIAAQMQGDKVLAIKSTVPVGTCTMLDARIRRHLSERGCPLQAEVISNPEFLKQGAAVGDFMSPDRILLGTRSAAAVQLLKALYAPFNRNRDKVMVMDEHSAELTKYAANAMLATRISLMNELANLAESLGGDIDAVRRGLGADPRIGTHYLYAGAGYGGACLPKDLAALAHMASEAGCPVPLIRSVAAVNDQQQRVLFEKISDYFEGELAGRTFAFWGLAFKPNTSDMRAAPCIGLIRSLLAAGSQVRAYDPAALEQAAQVFGNARQLHLCPERADTLSGACALVIMTEWHEFRSPDFAALKQALRTPAIFDGRNLFSPEDMAARGFDYHGIGRRTTPPIG